MIKMKKFLMASAVFALSAVGAHAASITNLGDGQAAYDLVDTSAGTVLQTGVSFDAFKRTGSVGVSRSPYDFSGSAGVTGFQDLEYFSIGPNNTPSPATMTIAGGANQLNFLWGSIDGYNGIELYSGGVLGTLLDTITNADIDPSSTENAGTGASYVSIFSADAFDTVVFTSSSNAFELANVTVSAVPLPAGVLMMGTALAGFGVMRRRKKAA
jgi:hypothetical protein